MQTYILRRVALMVPTLALVAVAIFVLTHLMPGDVVMIQLEGAASYSPEDYERLRSELGLDKPYFGQLGDWLWGHLDRHGHHFRRALGNPPGLLVRPGYAHFRRRRVIHA